MCKRPEKYVKVPRNLEEYVRMGTYQQREEEEKKMWQVEVFKRK
jgi:hypothetical protein